MTSCKQKRAQTWFLDVSAQCLGIKLKMWKQPLPLRFKDVPERQWAELLMVHLVIHFVWKKWLEVMIYIGSRPTVNGLVGLLVVA